MTYDDKIELIVQHNLEQVWVPDLYELISDALFNTLSKFTECDIDALIDRHIGFDE